GLPIEQHPAFLRPSVVGFVDVDRDGRRDLLTRASVVHCTGLQPDGSEAMLCHGSDTPLLCRLFADGRFGPPRPCPPYPGAMPDAPERGWSPPAAGRCPSRLHDRTPPRRGRRVARPPRRRRARLSTPARLSAQARPSMRAWPSKQARPSTRAPLSAQARPSKEARPSMRAWLEAVMR
ncbi:MAG TPA: hypothetical protein VFS00_32870, partial [Polyangiaceae bacterium]|nr:hypothetical protein [Polyangiaceae bacterium]